MSDITLDTNGDVLISGGNLILNSGVEAIRQHLQIRLRTFLGEWFLDQSVGVPYFQSVFVKNPPLSVLNAVITQAVLETPGIVSLDELSFTLEPNRQLNVTLRATTSSGVLDFSELIGV